MDTKEGNGESVGKAEYDRSKTLNTYSWVLKLRAPPSEWCLRDTSLYNALLSQTSSSLRLCPVLRCAVPASQMAGGPESALFLFFSGRLAGTVWSVLGAQKEGAQRLREILTRV